MVNKRRRIGSLLALAVLIGLAAWFTFRSPEPEYEGKPLSEWTEELARVAFPAQPESKPSAAIKGIGERAVPFLLVDLQTQTFPWQSLPTWLVSRLPDSFTQPTTPTRWEKALIGFRALGAIAEPAIPKLDELMVKGQGETPAKAQYALAFIGTDKVVPILMRGLTNDNLTQRRVAIVHLADLRETAAPAVPALLTNLESSDAKIRFSAAGALGLINSVPEVVVPALINLLGDPDRTVRTRAIASLAEFESGAVAAVPALEQLATDMGNSDFRERALRDGARAALIRILCEMQDGGIVRGPKKEKAIALVFTGHEYAEGAEIILNELTDKKARASLFLTGVFLKNTNFTQFVIRAAKEGHYVGPHSDKHLLYCAWDATRRTLLSEAQFRDDLLDNHAAISRVMSPPQILSGTPEEVFFRKRYGDVVQPNDDDRYFLPAYEHYNRQIADWTRERGFILINFTPGTRSNADYTGEADANFVSSQAIFDSILKREREDPLGLNGFILLFHLGSGPGRADKFHTRFGELLDVLAAKGYQFVRVDELLEPKSEDAKPKAE